MGERASADVSVVIPHFNAIATVGRSIDSVVAQTLSVREVIIVDDASADFYALERLIESYSDRLEIFLIRLPINRGAANARNVGVSHATSNYIAFLDSDDVWHPEKIAFQYGYMCDRSVNLTAHDYIFDLCLQPFPDDFSLVVKTVAKRRFVWGNPIFTPTVMVRRNGFVAFDERHQRMEDYKCWYENLKSGNHELLGAALAGGFKPAIGSSGLSGSAVLMHREYVCVLKSLRAEGKMSRLDYIFAVMFEFLKYPVRAVFIFVRR